MRAESRQQGAKTAGPGGTYSDLYLLDAGRIVSLIHSGPPLFAARAAYVAFEEHRGPEGKLDREAIVRPLETDA